jgi:TonB family protein
MGLETEDSRAATVKSGAISAALHAALFGLLLWLAWMTPAIREEILPVQLIREEPPKPIAKREEPKPEPIPEPVAEPAPAPKALAERRSMDFAPQAQAVAPQIVNPTVVAQASPQQNAQKIEMNQVAAVIAPQNISQATVVAERVTAVNSVAVAQTAKVDLGAAAPALRGPANAALPAGPSVGPTKIRDTGGTIGTGTAVDMGSGSSVREGIGSNRDVLGSPDGAPLANVATRVGDGFMRGDGGSGTGGGDTSECTERPEVKEYLEQVRQRMYSRWTLGGDIQDEQHVKLVFVLDASGSLMKSELDSSGDPALGQSAVEAMRSASPFAPMSERVRCLARRSLTGTFRTLH